MATERGALLEYTHGNKENRFTNIHTNLSIRANKKKKKREINFGDRDGEEINII